MFERFRSGHLRFDLPVCVRANPEAELDRGNEVVDLALGLRPDPFEIELLFPTLEDPFDFPAFQVAFHDVRTTLVRKDADRCLVPWEGPDGEETRFREVFEGDGILTVRKLADFQAFPDEFRISAEHRHVPVRFHPDCKAELLLHKEVEFFHIVIESVSENPVPNSKFGNDASDLIRKNREPRRFPFVALFKLLPFHEKRDSPDRDGVQNVSVHDIPSTPVPDFREPLHLFRAIFVQIDGIETEIRIRSQFADEFPEDRGNLVGKIGERLLPKIPREVFEDVF